MLLPESDGVWAIWSNGEEIKKVNGANKVGGRSQAQARSIVGAGGGSVSGGTRRTGQVKGAKTGQPVDQVENRQKGLKKRKDHDSSTQTGKEEAYERCKDWADAGQYKSAGI